MHPHARGRALENHQIIMINHVPPIQRGPKIMQGLIKGGPHDMAFYQQANIKSRALRIETHQWAPFVYLLSEARVGAWIGVGLNGVSGQRWW